MLRETNLRDVWCRNESVRAEIGQILQTHTRVSYSSIDCDGVTSSTGFINNLLSDTKIDILCLQETWLLDRDIAILSNIHADYQFNGKSGVDATERILPGRPQGGVAIAWHKGLSHYVKTYTYFQQAYVCSQNATECS